MSVVSFDTVQLHTKLNNESFHTDFCSVAGYIYFTFLVRLNCVHRVTAMWKMSVCHTYCVEEHLNVESDTVCQWGVTDSEKIRLRFSHKTLGHGDEVNCSF